MIVVIDSTDHFKSKCRDCGGPRQGWSWLYAGTYITEFAGSACSFRTCVDPLERATAGPRSAFFAAERVFVVFISRRLCQFGPSPMKMRKGRIHWYKAISLPYFGMELCCSEYWIGRSSLEALTAKDTGLLCHPTMTNGNSNMP